MLTFIRFKFIMPLTLLLFVLVQETSAQVPIKISIKFILNSSGDRPVSGNLNTDDEINAEIDWANIILANSMSEFRISNIELVDLPNISQWYGVSATGNNGQNRDNLRAAAIADPATYLWRTNAINIYINGGTSSAISKFPPDNDIILMNQWCGNTPSCILHELGHSLYLLHTHEPCCSYQDLCEDTINDNQGWSKDVIALNNFGTAFSHLSPSLQDQVNLVFNNVMSYHISEPQLRLSPCQLDRVSTQGDSDRVWLLDRQPVYVDQTYSGTSSGRFITPYKSIAAAVSNGVSHNALVIEQGTYDEPAFVIEAPNILMVPRSGSVAIGNGVSLYTLPTDLTNSQTPQVSQGARDVSKEDKAARKALKISLKEEAAAVSADEKKNIRARNKIRIKQRRQTAIDHLKKAEPFARGREQVAILLEIGQRYRHEGECEKAARFFNKVTELTEQPHLRNRALLEIQLCEMKKEESE